MKVIKCTHCNRDKSEQLFNIFRGKRNNTCIECRTKNNEWYAQDKGHRKTRAKIYYLKNKDRVSEYRSDRRLKVKYSLTRQDYNEMFKKQNSKCEICKQEFKTLCVDHDHKTGKIRALLCRRCNLDLQVIENKEFVLKAQSYLKSMI